jgi:hypothetical protein
MNPRHPGQPPGVAAALYQLLASLWPGYDAADQSIILRVRANPKPHVTLVDLYGQHPIKHLKTREKNFLRSLELDPYQKCSRQMSLEEGASQKSQEARCRTLIRRHSEGHQALGWRLRRGRAVGTEGRRGC